MIKIIYIASITRHGGSLLNRLLDSHQDLGSLPTEMNFPRSKDTLDFMENLPGIATSVPNFDSYGGNLTKFFQLEKNLDPVFEWGKEKRDKIGVRKNYYEKAYYDNFKTNFNKDSFIKDLNNRSGNIKNTNDIYKVFFETYFDNWDDGKHKKDFKYYVMHNSTGIYLDNFDDFFKYFQNSKVIVPVRNPVDYIASEKTRIARIFYGARRFYKPVPPNYLVKIFDNYDLKALIRSWKVSVTRYRLLQEIYKDDFFFYRYEDLVNKTNETMTDISKFLGIDFHDILLNPTLAGKDWGGNSHKGRLKGIIFSNYSSKVLKSSEIETIKKETNIWNDILNISDVNLDYLKISKKEFYHYDKQKKYLPYKDIINIYYSFALSGARKKQISKVGNLGLISFAYGLFVRLLNFPRLLKQKLFPSRGKQNYT